MWLFISSNGRAVATILTFHEIKQKKDVTRCFHAPTAQQNTDSLGACRGRRRPRPEGATNVQGSATTHTGQFLGPFQTTHTPKVPVAAHWAARDQGPAIHEVSMSNQTVAKGVVTLACDGAHLSSDPACHHHPEPAQP